MSIMLDGVLNRQVVLFMKVGRNFGGFGVRAELLRLRRGRHTRHDGKPDQPEQEPQDHSEGGETLPAPGRGQLVGAERPDNAPDDSYPDSHDCTPQLAAVVNALPMPKRQLQGDTTCKTRRSFTELLLS